MNARIILLACLVAVACARPQGPNDATILENFSEVNIDGFKFKFATSDGTAREETGSVANFGSENEELAVVGSYTYKDPEGKEHKVTFTADKDGFKPVVS
uniref:Uncharacterized protein n=1 Tax=Clastoptera arizonana TaxID=38151 RepID=A0A1B6C8S2_9HEMI